MPDHEQDSQTDTSAAPAEAIRAAFRELHGRRLHGFALLLTLGDRPQAARLAAEALADATPRIAELRHPERAAAWLRRHVARGARTTPGRQQSTAPAADVLGELGAEPPVLAGLAAIGRLERAGLIAASVERLDRRDVATIVGRDGASLDRLLRRARSRFADAHAAAAPDGAGTGPIVSHIQEVARRAMA